MINAAFDHITGNNADQPPAQAAVGGAVITEAVFAWPGLGTLVINSINARDWPIIQGSLIIIGASFVLVNIAVDALYAYVNPQVVYD